jgi:hypothetical protein
LRGRGAGQGREKSIRGRAVGGDGSDGGDAGNAGADVKKRSPLVCYVCIYHTHTHTSTQHARTRTHV